MFPRIVRAKQEGEKHQHIQVHTTVDDQPFVGPSMPYLQSQFHVFHGMELGYPSFQVFRIVFFIETTERMVFLGFTLGP